MNDVARTAAEDGVELVLSREREALVAAGLVAFEPIAVIPAPRALADVPGQCSGVADLRGRHASGGFGEHGVIFFRDQQLTPQQHIDFARCFGGYRTPEKTAWLATHIAERIAALLDGDRGQP